MRQCGAILHDQDALAADCRWILDRNGRSSLDDDRVRIGLAYILAHLGDVGQVGGIDLVQDYYVRSPEIAFPGIVGQLVSGPVWVGDDDDGPSAPSSSW